MLEGDEWGLEDVAVYQVPSQHSARDVDGAYERAMQVPIWPDAHDREDIVCLHDGISPDEREVTAVSLRPTQSIVSCPPCSIVDCDP
jgi:hypothetical protein